MQSPQEEKKKIEQCHYISYTTWSIISSEVSMLAFHSVKEEIIFFKFIIPLFIAELKYFSLRYHAACFALEEIGTERYKFWERERLFAKRFFTCHLVLYRYFKRHCSHWDCYLFTKEVNDIRNLPYTINLKCTQKPTKDFCNILASFIALERFECYINEILIRT